MQWLFGLINSNYVALIVRAVDLSLVLLLIYLVLSLSSDRRTLLMVRGIILLLLMNILSDRLGLRLLNFVLDKLLIGVAVAMAIILQPELRRFLERLGRGDILSLLQPDTARRTQVNTDSIVDEITDAVIELSQNRTGALMILETGEPIDDRDFSVPGVRLNALVSKELLHTIFQTATLLHDGAILIREERIIAAGVILPISDRAASREIGTRHRAAMGITERVRQCFCVVVSEETGGIAIAENGTLDRPVTSSRLREVLTAKLGGYRQTSLGRSVQRFDWLWDILPSINRIAKKITKK
ncbi:MAG: diadenylate cyclase CdaA [Pseudanabaena sp. ELA607]|jgi:uncharacterized protein (TIGR00159 family)